MVPTDPKLNGALATEADRDSRVANESAAAAFWAWFGSSKVVDPDSGEPLTVYHGTDTDFSEFSKRDVGFHFGSHQAANKRLDDVRFGRGEVKASAKQSGPVYIMPVYLSISHPLRMPDVGDWSNADQVAMFVGEMMIADDDFATAYEEAAAKTPGCDFRAVFERMGYDGIVYANVAEGGGDSWIAFRPEQIKFALSFALPPKSPAKPKDELLALESNTVPNEQIFCDQVVRRRPRM